jgi:uncharacterized protein (DUF58 family)
MSQNGDASRSAQASGLAPLPLFRRRVVRVRWRGPQTPPDPALIERRPLYAIAVALLLVALALRQPLLVVAGLLVGALALVPEIWYRFGLRGLVVRQTPVVRQAVLGDEVEIVLTAENRQPLPLPWVEIGAELPEALPVVGARVRMTGNLERVRLEATLGIWAYQRVRRRLRVRCIERGAFRLGPLRVRVSDPFGILMREQQLDESELLVVYPLIAPIQRLGLSPRAPFGEQKSSLRLLEDPLRVAGVRPYMPGDAPRRVHWKATARLGELQSKLYEPATRHTLAIFLDVRTLSRAVFGYDPALAELAITAAASVASWALDQGYAVGLYANGSLGTSEPGERPAERTDTAAGADAARDGTRDLERRIARAARALRLRVPPTSNPAQLTRILEGLARLVPVVGLPMESVLAGEQGQLPMGATLVYIGAETVVDAPLIVALRRVKAAGHTITLLLTGSTAETQAGGEPHLQLAGMAIRLIGGRETWHELVAEALGRGTAADGGAGADRAAETGPSDRAGRASRALVVE